MDIYMMTNEKGEKVSLEVSVSHREGRYNLNVGRVYLQDNFRTFVFPEEGRFGSILEYGRKLQKKLDRYNAMIAGNAERILGLWKEGKYSEIVNIVLITSPTAIKE